MQRVEFRTHSRLCAILLSLAAAGFVVSTCGGGEGGFTLGPEAQIDISPTVITFGDVPRGEVARQNITVRHVGTSGTIVLDPVRLETDSPDLSIGVVERTRLEPGETSRIQIVYTSAHDDPDEGVLVIGHNIAARRETRIPISTPGQRARLIPSPGVLDFGIVQAGAPRTLALTILNGGTAPATLTGYELSGQGGDFEVDLPVGAVVDVDGGVTFEVTYAPTGRDSDLATLTILTEREDVSVGVTLYGEEETPVLVVEPSLVQLGWTRPFETTQRQVVVRNEGNTGLDIRSITLVDHPSTLVLAQVPHGAFSLQPGDAVAFGIIFNPVNAIPMTAQPLGRIRVESSDEARDPLLVPVHGAAGDPSIRVIPEDIVDFAFVAEGFTAQRGVVVLNDGAAAVTVTRARLVEPTTDEFDFANESDLPRTLNPGESIELLLTFENRLGASGIEFARFYIDTTDPVVPEYPLDVVARRAQRPTCEAAFVPDLLAMGAYRPGETGTGTLRIVNFGSGNCHYREYDLQGCLSIQQGIRTRFECNNQIAMNPFEVVTEPTPNQVLGPGSFLSIPIAFHAPQTVTAPWGRESYYARLAVFMHDPNSNQFVFVAPPGGWGRGVNLRAEAAVPRVEVTPPALDFGLVRTDCESVGRQVRVHASGPIDATITQLELVGCGSDITIEAPPLPATVPGFGSVFLTLKYAPDAEIPLECTLRVHNDSDNLPIGEVALQGIGTDVMRQTDVFVQGPPPKVDVLFIVDDSFSMSDKQQLIKDELPLIVELATEWSQDYHLAVTTTDTILVNGQFQGFPPFVTADTPNGVEIFSQNLVVGTTGHYIERGLEGAYLALYSRSQRTDIACLNLPNQCPADDGEGVPLICVDGFCSGVNYGFLREDAELVIIIISDEEDASERPVPFYINAFANLKGPNSGVGVVVHSAVVLPSGCLGGFGIPGMRYIQVSEAFGGVVADLCADSFSEAFADVGLRTFGLPDRFYPTLPPDPATIEVRVQGAPCHEWSWNNATHSVIFDQGASCMPGHQEEVEIEYDVFCAAPAP